MTVSTQKEQKQFSYSSLYRLVQCTNILKSIDTIVVAMIIEFYHATGTGTRTGSNYSSNKNRMVWYSLVPSHTGTVPYYLLKDLFFTEMTSELFHHSVLIIFEQSSNNYITVEYHTKVRT